MEQKSENKKLNKKMEQFLVIGLGRFGKSVALSLAELGKEVLAVDKDPERVKQVENQVSSAVVTDVTGTEVLQSLDVKNFDCVINCIGGDFQSCILTTLTCKDLGVNYLVVKAKDEQNKKILEEIGADMVIIPEAYMGKKVANMLANPSMNDVLNLTENYKIVEIPVPDRWCEKAIIEIQDRKTYRVTIIFIKRENQVISPDPETVLLQGDILIVAGEQKNLQALSDLTDETIEVEYTDQSKENKSE